MPDPAWLPPLVLLNDSGGDWQGYLERIYGYFRADFIAQSPTFEGQRCGCKKHPLVNGKEPSFWHLISEGAVEDERLPDLRRCERIRWPRPIIERSPKAGVIWWRSDRAGDKQRIVIALDDFSYVVVLADRGRYLLLWTAFCVEREHRREKLRKEYEESR